MKVCEGRSDIKLEFKRAARQFKDIVLWAQVCAGAGCVTVVMSGAVVAQKIATEIATGDTRTSVVPEALLMALGIIATGYIVENAPRKKRGPSRAKEPHPGG